MAFSIGLEPGRNRKGPCEWFRPRLRQGDMSGAGRPGWWPSLPYNSVPQCERLPGLFDILLLGQHRFLGLPQIKDGIVDLELDHFSQALLAEVGAA